MRFFIPIECTDDENFIKFIISIISNQIISNLDKKKILAFNKNVDQFGIFKEKFDSYLVIKECTKRIKYVQLYKKGWSLFIQKKVYFPKYKKDLDFLCRFITYGNAVIRGYPVIKKSFDQVINNIDEYKQYYYSYFGKQKTEGDT